MFHIFLRGVDCWDLRCDAEHTRQAMSRVDPKELQSRNCQIMLSSQGLVGARYRGSQKVMGDFDAKPDVHMCGILLLDS